MKRSEVKTLSHDNYLRRIKVFERKNHDYADEDALSNFKRIAAICKFWGIDVTTPDGCADYLVVLKLDRYFNLKRQKKIPDNEPIEDTFVIDLPNYIDLSWALQVEENKDDA